LLMETGDPNHGRDLLGLSPISPLRPRRALGLALLPWPSLPRPGPDRKAPWTRKRSLQPPSLPSPLLARGDKDAFFLCVPPSWLLTALRSHLRRGAHFRTIPLQEDGLFPPFGPTPRPWLTGRTFPEKRCFRCTFPVGFSLRMDRSSPPRYYVLVMSACLSCLRDSLLRRGPAAFFPQTLCGHLKASGKKLASFPLVRPKSGFFPAVFLRWLKCWVQIPCS